MSLLKRSVINGYGDLLAWDDHTQELCRCRPTCITHSFPFATFSTPLLLPFPFSHSLFHLSTPFPLSASLSLTTTLISPPSLLTERRGGRTRTNGSLPLSSFSLSLSLLLIPFEAFFRARRLVGKIVSTTKIHPKGSEHFSIFYHYLIHLPSYHFST